VKVEEFRENVINKYLKSRINIQKIGCDTERIKLNAARTPRQEKQEEATRTDGAARPGMRT
jgi:hypothetical protein